MIQWSEHAGPWLRGEGPDSDVVISSRVRLARNVAGFPFLLKAGAAQRRELCQICRAKLLDASMGRTLVWMDLAEMPALERQLLVERHLISRQHGQGDKIRGLAVSDDESVAVMVNEEDHIRLQVMYSGMRLGDAYRAANAMDDALEKQLDFAFSDKLGYLTACPTNVGTGIRVSVMMHLPALKLTGEIEKVQRAARDMHMAVRGFYGEGTEALGDFYQVSNQTTLGRSEQEILTDFQDQMVPQIVRYEQEARAALAERRASLLDDRIQRAWAVLTHARLLGSEETLYLLSHLRMGLCMGRIEGPDLQQVNGLFALTGPAHLQRIAGRALTGSERREFRATFVRQRLSE
ncbi:MAG: protein arginine kinase [Phycisphaerales bacterium]